MKGGNYHYLASVQELSATVASLANSADDLKDIAVQLNQEISFFKDDNEEVEVEEVPAE